MSEKNNKPVSMRKTPTSDASAMTRPTTAVALAVAMLLSGLAAVVAAVSLYGQHGYLVRTLAKSQPTQVISSTTTTTISNAAGQALTTDLRPLVGTTLTSKQISNEADKVGAAVKTAIPPRNATKDQIKGQVENTTSAVSAQLKKLSGALTSTQVSAQAKALTSTVESNVKNLQKSQLSPQQIQDKARKAPTQILIQNLLLLVALGLVGVGAYVGRHWSRWAVPIIWVLASFTGTAAGFTSVLQLGSDLPAGYKFGGALSGLFLIVAVVLSFLRPNKDWFAAHRPVAADGAQRRGLFGPRVPPPSARTRPARGSARDTPSKPGGRFAPKTPLPANGAKFPASETASAAKDGSNTSASRTSGPKSKQRAAADSANKGAAAARARAKTASKSRRTTES